MHTRSFLSLILAVCLLFCAVAALVSCQKKADFPIDTNSWILVKALHDGKYIHYDASDTSIDLSNERYADATPIDVICEVKNGKITVTDRTNNKTYKGTCSVLQNTAEGTQFTIKFNGVEGKAYTMHSHTDGQHVSLSFMINFYIISFRAA